MIAVGGEKDAGATLNEAFADGAVLGKRYVDADGAEVLVARRARVRCRSATPCWCSRNQGPAVQRLRLGSDLKSRAMSLLSGPTGRIRFSPPPTYPLTADGCVSTSPTAACAGRTCLFFITPEPMTGHVLGREFSGTISGTRVRCRRLVGRRQRGGAAHRRVRRVPRVPAGPTAPASA